MKPYASISPKMPHLIHGGDYNPDQWIATKEIWKEDMRLAKLAGINSLTIGIFSWVSLEPEDGRYTFEWMDEVMDLLAENGMVAVLATPSGARPAWMSQKYPEVLRVQEDRCRILHGQRHNHCFTSPVYRRKVREINTLLAQRYKDHPALGVWHLSNEYGGDCHCELCQQAFRDWLKARYGTLENLNHQWWTAFWSHTYTDWSQIESPSFTLGEYSVHGLELSWRRFVTDQTLDFMQAEIAPLKQITPEIPVTTNMMGFYDGLNYFRLSEGLDIASWDNYPLWNATLSDLSVAVQASFLHDFCRGLKDGKPWMLMESSPSATNWQPVGKLRRPGGHKLYSLQAVAHGSDTVQYFQYRKSRGSSEKFHGAVVDHEGSENTRVFREVADTGVLMQKLDEIVGCETRSQVAIVYDVENRWAMKAAAGFKSEKKYVETLLSHYKPFWQAGVSVDIVDSTKPLEGYKLVVAPMLYMLRDGMAERLDAFVRAGGTLVVTYLSGYVDQDDLCFLGGFPGPLKDTLGVWCEEMDGLPDGESRAVRYGEGEYLAHDFCEIIHLRGAQAMGVYDEDFYEGMPAVTRNAHGKGQAWFVAARLDERFQQEFFCERLQELNIDGALLAQLPAGVTAQTRSDGQHDYVFVMNFFLEPATVDIGAGGVDMDTGKPIQGEVELLGLSLLIFRRDRR